MPWNWQFEDWPKFTYRPEEIAGWEQLFFQNAGVLLGSLKYMDPEQQQALAVDLLSQEAYKTTEIEGELLDRASIQSSIRRHFGLQTDARRASPAENGIAEMMVDLYRHYDSPLSSEMLFSWHKMLMDGRRDLADIGQYRSHEDAMQIVSGRLDRPTVYFEAPPSARVLGEMEAFLQWFNGAHPAGVLVRAGIAHLYFESIHPFEDGNGRLGRAISEKALSQGLQRPALIAISHVIQRNKKDYYAALHHSSATLDITEWLRYFCGLVITAQEHTLRMVDFVVAKGRFFHKYESALNDRQRKVVDRIFREGLDGFQGGLSADNYARIAKSTSSTTTRDLQKLVEMGAMLKTGQRKGTRYWLHLPAPPPL